MSPEELAANPQAAAEMMAEYEEMVAPDEHQEMLTYFVGDWTVVMKMWMDPTALPMEAPGTMTAEMIMDGRFVKQEFHASMMGQPFTGTGMIGYDNYSGKYQSIWIDSVSTTMHYLEGHSSRNGDSISLYGQMDEPQLGIRGRMVEYIYTVIDEDTFVFVANDLHIGKENNTVIEVTYTRVK